ncbi:MAG: DUF3592 domain-containing protein [Bacteroidota bacterium]
MDNPQKTPLTPAQLRRQKITGYVIIGIGLALFGFGVIFVQEARESVSWPIVEGTVQNVSVKRYIDNQKRRRTNVQGTTQYYYAINYRYTIDGTSHSGSQFSLGEGDRASKLYGDMPETRAAGAAAYPSGSKISIHVNPDNPARAVLSTGANWGTYVPGIIGLLMLGLGAVLVRKTEAHPVVVEAD